MKRNLSIICLVLAIGLSSFSFPVKNNIVDDILAYTNQFRRSKGLPALVIRGDMNAIAQRHSEDMARGRVQFGHAGFENRELQIRRNIKDASQFAENVAYGSSTGRDVVNGWKNSPGHRRNLLGPYKYIGIGVARDRRGRLYYTQVFVD